jgi:ribosomal protein S12 methylthiotransferase accessory factor YcaO
VTDSIVNPNPPVEPAAVPPITAEVARPSAEATLRPVAQRMDAAMAAVATAQEVADSWTEEFWAVCGYDKSAVTEALTQLSKLAGIYEGSVGLAAKHDFSADADVLVQQEDQSEPTA